MFLPPFVTLAPHCVLCSAGEGAGGFNSEMKLSPEKTGLEPPDQKKPGHGELSTFFPK